MAKTMNRKHHEPGWGEVILGAVLSVVLGVVLGAVALVFKPVEVVKDIPKEPVAGQTYFIQGSRDTGKARQAAAKRKAFAQASPGVFTVSEDDLNVLAGPPMVVPGAAPAPGTAPAPKAKPGEKAAPTAPGAAAVPAAPTETFATGTPNFRIRPGVVQIGFPVTVSLLGVNTTVMVQSQGMFVKKGEVFVFEPESLLVGSCPVQRLPYASTYVTKKFLNSQTIAEDVAGAWPKVASISVEGNMLKLTMP